MSGIFKAIGKHRNKPSKKRFSSHDAVDSSKSPSHQSFPSQKFPHPQPLCSVNEKGFTLMMLFLSTECGNLKLKENIEKKACQGKIPSRSSSSAACAIIATSIRREDHQTALYQQLAHYPRTPSGDLHEQPRIANYSKMEHSGGKDMALESKRLATFGNWPTVKFYILPEDLAKSGFYRDNSYENQSDRVKCAFCRGVLHSWEKGDEPMKEHRRAFSTCPFVLSMNVGNVPIMGRGQIPIQYSPGATGDKIISKRMDFPSVEVCCGGSRIWRCEINYLCIKNRIESFSTISYISVDRSKKLARLGFFYTGRDSLIQCYKCHFQTSFTSSSVKKDHESVTPPCPVMIWVNSLKTIKSENPSLTLMTPKLSDSEISTRVDSWSVRQAISLDFDRDLVRHVVLQYASFSGEQVGSLQMLVEDIVELEREMKKCGIDMENKSVALEMWREILGQKLISQKLEIQKRNQELSDKILRNPELLKQYWDDPELKEKYAELNRADKEYQEQMNEQLKVSQQCKICMDRNVDTIFIPCHHIVACSHCTNSLTECPICRSPIESTIQANIE